jgi:Kef-type K+ transport system membrane component KefB
VEVTEGLASLFVIVGVAALAPFVVAILPGPKIPEVAVLLVLGVVIGPQVLDVAQVSEPIGLFAAVGLGFLFFVAGFELPPELIRGRLAKRAGLNWLTAVALALLAAGFLHWTGVVRDTAAVAIALTSTALGTLLPILRDAGITERPLGRAVLANGAVGEFGPIVAISLLLGARGALTSLVVLAVFGVVALLLAALPSRFGPRSKEILLRGRETTSHVWRETRAGH